MVLILTTIASIFYFIYAYRRREIPGARNFMILMIFVVIYNMGYVFELNSKSFEQALFWYRFEHIAAPIQPYIWLLIAIEFTGISKQKQKIVKRLGMIHPIIYYLSFFTNSLHYQYDKTYRFVSNGYFNIIATEKGFLYQCVVVTGTGLGVLIIGVYLVGCFKAHSFYRNIYIVMILASTVSWISEYINQTPWNTLKLDWFPIALILTALIYLYGIFRFRIMSTIPIAHEMLTNQSKEGILVVDMNGYIIDANNTFLNLFPNCMTKFQKEKFSVFLSEHPNIKKCIEEDKNQQFSILLNEETRYCSGELVDISIEQNIVIGKMLVVSDITMYIENQRMLEEVASKAIEKADLNEVAFLQAQINPHFLNNTLSLISSMVSRNPQKAKETIANLGEYLMRCYQFDAHEPMVTLEEELAFADIYVTIEKTRFMERLDVMIHYEEMPQIKVPRLILQPLVENAIRHGVLKKVQGGTVKVELITLEREVLISVSDDGVGIKPERIPDLLEGLDKEQGVGIVNIHKRLLRYYGSGLTIACIPEGGTKISFSIPC